MCNISLAHQLGWRGGRNERVPCILCLSTSHTRPLLGFVEEGLEMNLHDGNGCLDLDRDVCTILIHSSFDFGWSDLGADRPQGQSGLGDKAVWNEANRIE